MTTTEKFCRFTLFVKLWPGVISTWPDLKRVWCMRGDKFTNIENKQLKNLLNHAKNNMHRYSIIELYDNTFKHDDTRRIILKYNDGVFVLNNLEQYKQSLKDFPLPTEFKS